GVPAGRHPGHLAGPGHRRGVRHGGRRHVHHGVFDPDHRPGLRGVLPDRGAVRLSACPQRGPTGPGRGLGTSMISVLKPSVERRMSLRFPRVFAQRALLLGVVASLGACATAGVYQRPDVAVPAQWQQSQAAAPEATVSALSASWWEVFGDPTLNQLVDAALARNNNLAVAAVRVRRAQLLAGLASSARLPSINAGVNASASRALDGGDTTRNNGVSVGASWELDLWGRLAAQRDVAEWEAKATEEDRQAAALALVGTTAQLYWQVAY